MNSCLRRYFAATRSFCSITEMDVHLDIMFHHGRKFQKDENGMTIYSPDKKACVGDIDVDTLDVFWVRNYYKELGYDRIGECWWHVPGRSLDIGLRALNCDDELREMCFMGEKNEGLVDVYFEHVVSTPEILEGNEIVEYVEGDHDDLRETPFTKNTEPMHNTSPPKTTEPTDPGANNPTPQNNNPTTTPNSNLSQATTAKPVTTTPPVLPKMKPNTNVNPNLKSNTTSSHKATANPKNAFKPKPKPNQNSVSKPKPKPKPKIRTKAYCTRSASQLRTRHQHEKKKQVLRLSSSKDEHTTEDSSYDPGRDDSSTDDDIVKKCEIKRRKPRDKHAPAEGLAKSKRKFLNDDDALVVDDEECDVDLSFLKVLVTGDENLDNSYDPGVDLLLCNNRPQAPKKKKKPGPVTKKRRKDADEGNEGSKKSKGHTKRGCPKKRAADVAQALADAAAKTKPTKQAPTQAPPDAPAQDPPEAPSQVAPEAPAQPPAPVEIDLSQPNYSDAQQSQHSQEDPPARPSKLQTRRRSSTPPSGSITVDPLQGASSATSSRLANFLKFVPTPDFKPPRKKK
ncbi:hypothetical protein Ahy_B09g098700 [Arachis hypogaea]|uniref:PB1-like domain-containing protein n=1 Tax=Arachis hypogaea TaxID=3818 RepID=A0A444XSL1_ARAHY|nr:hypothetical protein Ahy_B09g098700 [Arachis hypogaea]